jgi:predicted ATPase/class 3 adenylate cyclase
VRASQEERGDGRYWIRTPVYWSAPGSSPSCRRPECPDPAPRKSPSIWSIWSWTGGRTHGHHVAADRHGHVPVHRHRGQHPTLALARHDALLRAAIQTHSGHVFKTIGDAFCVAFPTPADALAAAVDAQLGLHAEPWGRYFPPTKGGREVAGRDEGRPPPRRRPGAERRHAEPGEAARASARECPLRVRMALHAGAVEHREGDYFGAPLNRVARLLAAGHGGQVLLSQATCDLVRQALPSGVSLRDLGAHRLKDLRQPEQIAQLLHPDLPQDFPPLRSLEAFAHNLPAQLTSFVGREREMAEVRRLLRSTRLLTLTGAGGCGKTRLALQVAADLLEQYADGVWLVELAALADPALVPQTVAAALGVREQPGRSLTETLSGYLRRKSLLLLLDNCEHLLAACSHLAESLLRSCPNLRILASSREGLGIAGETAYRVPSLSLPDLQRLPSVDALTQFEAVRLFVERAGAALPSFALNDGNAPAVASVCRRLDGIPLAIELAAARVKALPVEKIAERLDDRFRLLTGGSRTALPRQQTLRALIDWSYDLLSEAERALLRRLSVFAGGWTLEAAEVVCADDEPTSDRPTTKAQPLVVGRDDVLEVLTQLVDRSLVQYEEPDTREAGGGEARYRLLETVRQYGRDRLLESGEAEGIRWQHARLFLALAEKRGDPGLAVPAELAREHDNLRAALEWFESQQDGSFALRLTDALGSLWLGRGHLAEGREYLARVLSRVDTAEPTAARARALDLAGMLAGASGDYGPEQQLHEECLAIYRALGDRLGIAGSLQNLAYAARNVGDYTRARALTEQSLEVAAETGDKGLLVYVLSFGGYIIVEQGDHAVARTHLERSLAISREIGDKPHPMAHFALALVDRAQGDFAPARAHLWESLAHQRDSGFQRFIPNTLISLAGLEAALGQAERAARLFGAADVLREAMGVRLSVSEREAYERDIAVARSALGEGPFAAAWAEGQAMTLRQAVAYALAG